MTVMQVHKDIQTLKLNKKQMFICNTWDKCLAAKRLIVYSIKTNLGDITTEKEF